MKLINLLLQYSRLLGFTLLVFLGMHYYWGQVRWQYIPLYILVGIYLLAFLVRSFMDYSLSAKASRWLIGLSLFLLFLSIVFSLIFPEEKMPEPSGSHAIGTQIFEATDPERLEKYSDETDAYRKIRYQVWYPTDETKSFSRANWLLDGKLVSRQLLRNLSFPAPTFMLDQAARVKSHAYIDAPISEALEQYPLVVISHGWKSFGAFHADYAEELASQGFIAVTIDHSYGAQAVKFSDGEVVYINNDALPSNISKEEFAKAAHQLAKTYGEDVKLVLDEFEDLNENHPDFKGKIDQEKIGLVGHSTGGAGDVYLALEDPRIKALIGLDAWVNPLATDKLSQGLTMPALFLRSEEWGKRERKETLNLLVDASDNAQIIEVTDANHLDYPMTYIFSPYTKWIGLTGGFGDRKDAFIQKEMIHDFFVQHLNKEVDTNDSLNNYLKTYDFMKLRKTNSED